jgi:hypothetical protein
MDEAAKVPPPAYDPDLVADAVLHAAEIPTREITRRRRRQLMTLAGPRRAQLADRTLRADLPPLAKDAS